MLAVESVSSQLEALIATGVPGAVAVGGGLVTAMAGLMAIWLPVVRDLD